MDISGNTKPKEKIEEFFEKSLDSSIKDNILYNIKKFKSYI